MNVARKSIVSLNDFITAWETSENVQEVCDKVGISKTTAQARASKYRGLGIPVKKMTRGGGGKSIDTDGALQLIASLRETNVEEVRSEGENLMFAAEMRSAARLENANTVDFDVDSVSQDVFGS